MNLSGHDANYEFSVWEIESASERAYDMIVTINNNKISRNRFSCSYFSFLVSPMIKWFSFEQAFFSFLFSISYDFGKGHEWRPDFNFILKVASDRNMEECRHCRLVFGFLPTICVFVWDWERGDNKCWSVDVVGMFCVDLIADEKFYFNFCIFPI